MTCSFLPTFALSCCLGLSSALAGWPPPRVSAAPPPGGPERRMYGQWHGLLPVTGGSAALTIAVTELADGRRTALLDVPLQRLNRVALTVTVFGDSVRFAATKPAVRFAGRWMLGSLDKLEGTWRDPSGADAPLTLERMIAAEPAKAKALPYLAEEVRFVNATASAGALASAGADSKAGLSLAGTLTRPAGKGPFPAIVLLSDQGAQDRDAVYDTYRFFAELADGLTRAGFVVLRYDDRGTGQSTGSLPDATAAELATDAQAGLNFLRARPDVDVTRLGLLGHGEGANVALLAAAGPLPPSFVVALAGYGIAGHAALVQQQAALVRSLGADEAQVETSIRRQRDMLTIVRNMTDKDLTQAIVANMLRQDSPGLDLATAQTSAAQMLTRSYRTFLEFDPLAQLGQVKCPVLLLGGSADEQVNTEVNFAALQKGLRNDRSVTAVKLPGVNHLFQPDAQQWPVVGGLAKPVVAPAALAALTAWLQRQTAP